MKSYTNKSDLPVFLFFLIPFFLFCFIGGFWGVSGDGSFIVYDYVLIGAKFVLIYSFIFIPLIFMFFFFPFKGFDRKSIAVIFILSILARVLIFFQDPSDDIYRYLWEGFVFNEGVNPYITPPNDMSLFRYAANFINFPLINHPDMPAAYPPLVILLFSFLAKISLSIPLIKFVVVCFDLGSIYFLIKIVQSRNIDIRWTILYALNPLILYSFAGGGHIDAMQNFFLLWAIHSFDRKKWLGVFFLIGLAIQTKYVAVIALPFLINRENFKYVPIILIPLILPYLPFLSCDINLIFTGIVKFGEEFAFNGPVHSILRYVLEDMRFASLMTKTLFMGLFFYGVIKICFLERSKDPVNGISFAFASLLILTPTLHIWYISWILPFVIIRGTTSWIVLTLSASMYYVTTSVVWYGNDWSLPLWAQIMEWSPFFLFFIFELYFSVLRTRYFFRVLNDSITVVIPVLNEEIQIIECINSVKNCRVDEIIVVDGGSSDNTVESAKNSGVITLINDNPIDDGGGRGGQILTGVSAATSDIVAVVHSDTIVKSDTFNELKKFLSMNTDVVGGACGTKFNSNSKMKLIELLNGLRAVFFGVSFGDQIQFFRRDVVFNNNLFPNIPLMEDVELSIILPKIGRTVFLFGDSTVSTRRWEKKGISNFFQVLGLFVVYLLKRPFKKPDTVKMYKNYYKIS